jgi:hypothetical protein
VRFAAQDGGEPADGNDSHDGREDADIRPKPKQQRAEQNPAHDWEELVQRYASATCTRCGCEVNRDNGRRRLPSLCDPYQNRPTPDGYSQARGCARCAALASRQELHNLHNQELWQLIGLRGRGRVPLHCAGTAAEEASVLSSRRRSASSDRGRQNCPQTCRGTGPRILAIVVRRRQSHLRGFGGPGAHQEPSREPS